MNSITFIIMFIYGCKFAVGFPAEGLEIREILPSPDDPESQAKFFIEVDVSTCSCINLIDADECDIAIYKSSVLEISCSSHETYCCSGRTRQENHSHASPTLSKSFNDTLKRKPSNVSSDLSESRSSKDTITDFYQGDDTQVDDVDLNEVKFRLIKIQGSKTPPPARNSQDTASGIRQGPKKCLCKPREQCPEEYRDYSFGFYCNYNTTRCCEPVVEVLRETGRHIFPSILNSQKTNGTEKVANEGGSPIEYANESFLTGSNKCHCLPREECQKGMDSNVVLLRRQDTLCPKDLVQCCSSQPDESENYKEDKLDEFDEFEENDDENIGDDILRDAGGPGHQQPIPLSELKIPVTEEDDDDNKDNGWSISTLAPPKLPTYYNYQSPTHYSGYYYPSFTTQQDNVGTGRNTASDYDNDQNRPRYNIDQTQGQSYAGGDHQLGIYPGHRSAYNPVPVEQFRTISPEASLFDKIAKLIG